MLFVNTLKSICRILSFISSFSCSSYKSAQYRPTEYNSITWYNATTRYTATTRYKSRLGTLKNDYCSYQTCKSLAPVLSDLSKSCHWSYHAYHSLATGLIRHFKVLPLVLSDLSKSCHWSYQTLQSLATGIIRPIKVLPLVLSDISKSCHWSYQTYQSLATGIISRLKSAGQEKSTKILISWQEFKNQFLSFFVHRQLLGR